MRIYSRRGFSHSGFTLVELIIAMAVFTVLMFALMQFFSSAQKAWTSSANKTQLYEDSRIALEMMANDLRNAYYEPGHSDHKLFIAIPATSVGSGYSPQIAVVSTRGVLPNSYCKSNVCEVVYGVKDYKLYINVTGDKTALNADNDYWNPTEEISSTLAASTNVFTTKAGGGSGFYENWQEIVPNVVDFSVKYYNKALSEITSNFTGVDKMPYMAVISLTLVDEDTAKKCKSKHSGPLDASDDLVVNNKKTFVKAVTIDRGQY